MEAEIKLSKNDFATFAAAVAFCLPKVGIADHVPDNLSQDLDPNYIACLIAVDDAETEFRDALQSTCLHRMGDLCSGRNGIAPPSQVIDCIYFETRRAIGFLTVSAGELPELVQTEGLFGQGYDRRHGKLLRQLELLRNSPRPKSIEIAVQQTLEMASAATLLFWLARETQTPLEVHAGAYFSDH